MSLKKLRQEKGLTSRYVAEKLNVLPSHLTHIEGGHARLTTPNAIILAKVYQVDVEEIIKASGQLIKDEAAHMKTLREL